MSKIWVPELKKVYRTTLDGETVYIRFTGYGSVKRFKLSWTVYSDEKCKKVHKTDYTFDHDVDIYELEFEPVGFVEKINEWKLQTDIDKLLTMFTSRTNQRDGAIYEIEFTPDVTVVPEGLYLYYTEKTLFLNDDGTFKLAGTRDYARRIQHVSVESFTPDKVLYLYAKIKGVRFWYNNKLETPQFIFDN